MSIWNVCRSNPLNLEELEEHLRNGADLNFRDNDGFTPFQVMCHWSNRNGFNLKILELCVSKGADLNAKDNIGQTPFYLICQNSDSNGLDVEMLKFCIKKGADLNIADIIRTSPFYLICCNAKNDKLLKYIGKKIIVNQWIIDQCIRHRILTRKKYIKYFLKPITVDRDDPDILIY